MLIDPNELCLIVCYLHLCTFYSFSNSVSIIVLGSFETSLTIEEQSLKVQRRDLLLHTVFGALSIPAMVPFAYAEEGNKFPLNIQYLYHIKIHEYMI